MSIVSIRPHFILMIQMMRNFSNSGFDIRTRKPRMWFGIKLIALLKLFITITMEGPWDKTHVWVIALFVSDGI